MQLTKVEIKGRRWYKGPDGRLYPSASSVLEVLFPESKKWISEDDLARGTACHEATARVLIAMLQPDFELVESALDPDPVINMRVASIIEYLAKFQLETMAVESPTLYLDIGMTPDFLAREMGPDSLWLKHLYDWKFAEDVTEQYYFQAELYGRAEGADKVTILQCNRKGEVFPHRVRPDEERWELIKSAINVRHHIDKGVKRYV
jgi:hypothetical protein